jgi:hypothetical protein
VHNLEKKSAGLQHVVKLYQVELITASLFCQFLYIGVVGLI